MKLAMLENLDVMRAQQSIQDGHINYRDPEGVYGQYMLAFGSEALAEAAELNARKMLVAEVCG